MLLNWSAACNAGLVIIFSLKYFSISSFRDKILNLLATNKVKPIYTSVAENSLPLAYWLFLKSFCSKGDNTLVNTLLAVLLKKLPTAPLP